MWWCKHKDYSGNEMTILHDGDQCQDENHQNKSCTLYQKTWDFVSCRKSDSAIVLINKKEIHLVPISKIKKVKKP